MRRITVREYNLLVIEKNGYVWETSLLKLF